MFAALKKKLMKWIWQKNAGMAAAVGGLSMMGMQNAPVQAQEFQRPQMAHEYVMNQNYDFQVRWNSFWQSTWNNPTEFPLILMTFIRLRLLSLCSRLLRLHLPSSATSFPFLLEVELFSESSELSPLLLSSTKLIVNKLMINRAKLDFVATWVVVVTLSIEGYRCIIRMHATSHNQQREFGRNCKCMWRYSLE